MKIYTKRLILRPLKMSDSKSISDNMNLDISRWLLVVPHPYTLNDAKQWIKNSQKKWKKKDKEDYPFGIELKSERKIIGGMGLHHLDKHSNKVEVGYWIGKNYQGKGYGKEALKSILDFAFNKLKVRRIEASVFDKNPTSTKLLEKFKFKNEGMKIKSVKCKADGKIKDEIIYGLVRNNQKIRQ